VEELTDSIARRRARHVVSENQRVLAAVEAMRKGDPETVGALMNRSHESLATDYEVSSEALDAISSIARDQPGCFGARLTGGGFAGCAVALVERDRCAAIVEAIRAGFEEACGKKPVLWAVKPASGATVARVDS